MAAPELRTARLRLRAFEPADLAPFAALNADPEVMEFLPTVLSRAESDAFAARIADHWRQHGFGLFAVEVPGEISCAGFVGLAVPGFEAAFTPCVEVGWRLARVAWGRGLASEAARACLAFGFEQRGLEEIVSFTSEANRRSWAVMERIGMTRDPADDFEHPSLPAGHRLRRHVLYRLARPRWRAAQAGARA